MIEFGAGVFADFAAVLAASRQVGADVVIADASLGTVTLKSVTLAQLTADDFRFV